MREEVIVGRDKWLHLPSNCGVRLRADDERVYRLGFNTGVIGDMAESVLVIESDQGFQAVWAEGDLKVEKHTEGSRLASARLQTSSWMGSLEEAVSKYRQVRPLAPKVDPTRYTKARTQLLRCIILEMMLIEGQIAHTYADAVRLVKELAALGLSQGTLLYIPGWNARYDTGYPIYKACEALGGEEGLYQLVEVGREHGVIVLPHTNYWGYDANTKLLPNYQEFQVYVNGQPQYYPGNTYLGLTNRIEYMRVDDSRWTDVWFDYVDKLMKRYRFDFLYLDQIGYAPDEGIKAGSIKMMERLNASYPQVVFGGEIMMDFLLPYIDFYQIWGTPWSGLKGLDDVFPWCFSPIVRLLHDEQAIFVPHLGEPAAVSCHHVWTNYPYIVEHGQITAFARNQEHMRLLGALPGVRLAYNTHGLDPLSLMVLRS